MQRHGIMKNSHQTILDLAAQRGLIRPRDLNALGLPSVALTRYVIERLLYRISISKHADQFLLKGALLFDLWFDIPHRPTRDADFLGFGSAELPHVEYPVMLSEFAAPKLRVYPRYTVVAEKFEALSALGIANSRMKDYFDLWILV